MRNAVSIIWPLVILFMFSNVYGAEGFPGRAEFENIPVYEIDYLFERRADVTVVDVRSNYEYKTLHIKGAINIPVAWPSFEDEILKLRDKTTQPIVFYCNGHTCYKSYIATKRSMKKNISNVYAYDAGIFDWARAYPKETVLLGKSPINPNDLISKKQFKSKLLDPNVFSKRAIQSKRAIVLDIRDKYQRAGVGFFPGIEKWTHLDRKKKLDRYIKLAVQQNKTLYIYDEVGKQVRWFQYALERAGVKDYYFMNKGAKGYYTMLADQNWNTK